MGKTSIDSRWNIPGKIAWVTMEAPGFITLLYIMSTLPHINGLKEVPTGNWLMAVLFVSGISARARVARCGIAWIDLFVDARQSIISTAPSSRPISIPACPPFIYSTGSVP